MVLWSSAWVNEWQIWDAGTSSWEALNKPKFASWIPLLATFYLVYIILYRNGYVKAIRTDTYKPTKTD